MSGLSIRLPNNEAEFEQVMEKVDQYLRDTGVPPHARPVRGWFEISRTLRLGLRMVSTSKVKPRDGCYTGDDLSIRIFRWFDGRYGERLKNEFGPGRVFLLVRGDPWLVFLPRFWGTIVTFASTAERSTRPEVYLRQKEPPRLNVLDLIEAFPDGLRASLRPEELAAIHQHVLLGIESLLALELIEELPMVREARSDIAAAVEHAVGPSPHYGQSRWSSLQATEKAIKVLLTARQQAIPHHHNLDALASLAEAAGLPSMDRGRLGLIQCSAGIRYGDVPTTAFQAFNAHEASLQEIGHLARSTAQILPERGD